MTFKNRKPLSASTSVKVSGAAITAALVGVITFGNGVVSRADVSGTTKPTTGAPTVHRMVMTPVWVTKPGSGPVIGGLVAHMTTKHAAQTKLGAMDIIEDPIWPVTPPDPAPTDPSDGSGSGDGSGG